jgi:predicted TIM-barrel fold metal-dependent hydrolase
MSAELLTLENPALKGIDLPARRPIEKPNYRLPPGLEVISADGHWEISEDVFFDRFPKNLRDRAPRVWFDESYKAYNIGSPDAAKAIPLGEMAREMLETHYTRGIYDIDERLEHMLADGVSKEIVFPQVILMYFNGPDLDVREEVFRIYNEHMAEKGARIPNRFYGVGVCSNWWDPNRMATAVQQIKDLGLKTYMLPNNPGKNLQGKELNYSGEDMEPLWDAAEKAGLPVCFHVAETFNVEGRGVFGGFLLNTFGAFRKTVGQLIFGGVFDRHPNLKIVFAEGGISWVPPMLQDAEAIYDSYLSAIRPAIKHRPTYYWRNNCYATFQNDNLGLKQLNYIGEDRVMWAGDYPHPEGSHGYSHSSIKAVLELTSEAVARKILGDTARKVFNL